MILKYNYWCQAKLLMILVLRFREICLGIVDLGRAKHSIQANTRMRYHHAFLTDKLVQDIFG
jgi:hypothetical protein